MVVVYVVTVYVVVEVYVQQSNGLYDRIDSLVTYTVNGCRTQPKSADKRGLIFLPDVFVPNRKHTTTA